MMRATLIRDTYTDTHTLGRLHVYDALVRVLTFKTLELPWENNARNVSCIPAGEYPVLLEYSPKFKMDLFELKHVPGRSEIKFHAANYVRQLNGCIALGTDFTDLDKDGKTDVVNSRASVAKFMKAFKDWPQWNLTVVGDGRDTLSK